MGSMMRGLRRWWERIQRVDGRRLQLEIDTHRLCFLTNHKAGNEKTAEEISQLVSRASFEDQQRQVQKNVHEQVCHIARVMDQILGVEPLQEREISEEKKRVRPSGLSLALGEDPAMKLKQQNLQDRLYALNSSYSSNLDTDLQESAETRLWQLLGGNVANDGARKGAILERSNPLALAHYVNHPINGVQPNVMICAYDYLSTDTNLRPYIPNVPFDDDDQAMRRRGLLWVRAERDEEGNIETIPMIRTIVLVTTTEVCNEELFLNYRLSNSKYWPDWYKPVDRDEDMRRWE